LTTHPITANACPEAKILRYEFIEWTHVLFVGRDETRYITKHFVAVYVARRSGRVVAVDRG
jgi:hypothetical protein